MGLLSRAEDHLLQDRFQETLKALESIDIAVLSREEYGLYSIIYSEANLYIGELSKVCTDEAIEIFRHSADTESFARAKFIKGWAQSAIGEHDQAKETLIEAYSQYLRCQNMNGAARTLNRISYVAFQTGNIGSAITNLQKCLAIYEELGDRTNAPVISMNLAMLQFRAGWLGNSISGYTEVRPSIIALGDKNAVAYYNMSALPHALKGDYKTARAVIARARPFIDKYPRENAIYYENRGLIAILEGNYREADKALRKGLEISLEIAPESALVSQIKRLFGDLYIAMDDYEQAERYANEALKVAEKINERVEIAACYRIFAQLALHNKQGEKAREWYDRAIDLFRMIGSQYELAATRVLAAESNLYEKNERTAMLYMARRYFESEQVADHVRKIDNALRAFPVMMTADRAAGKPGAPTIVAESPQMKSLLQFAEQIAPADVSILLTGETGTGKDVLARYIHHVSGRQGKFVSVNAAALPHEMIESELFGYKKGAFTGAGYDRPGLFEEADNGTFYLNEIADATPEFQAKLLEVLETHQVRRLGSNTVKTVNFRLLAATNHDLKECLHDNRFRRDLYHRLNEVQLHLEPLRKRSADTPALVRSFLTFAGFSLVDGNRDKVDRLAEIFGKRIWPGNVRELQAAVKSLWLKSQGNIDTMIELAIRNEHLSESEILLHVLEKTDWNRREAGRILGISDAAVRRRIKKYNLSQTI